MLFNKTTATVLALSLAALLTGCEAEQTEKDMIAEAQFCLDKAEDSSSAQACMSKISGLTSPQAYTLRCAADFIGAGITSPQNLSEALTAINEGAGATSMLAALSFPSVSAVNSAFNNCNLSGNAGLKLIAAMSKSATTLANLGLGSCTPGDLTTCDAAAIEQSITNLYNDLTSGSPSASAQEQVTDIVTSIQTVYNSTCGTNSGLNGDICTQINSAVASSGYNISTANPAELVDIGIALLNEWKNN